MEKWGMLFKPIMYCSHTTPITFWHSTENCTIRTGGSSASEDLTTTPAWNTIFSHRKCWVFSLILYRKLANFENLKVNFSANHRLGPDKALFPVKYSQVLTSLSKLIFRLEKLITDGTPFDRILSYMNLRRVIHPKIATETCHDFHTQNEFKRVFCPKQVFCPVLSWKKWKLIFYQIHITQVFCLKTSFPSKRVFHL